MTNKKETLISQEVENGELVELTVIETIKKAMKNRGVSQAALAEKLGINRTSVTHFLTGRIKIDLARMFAIADILQIDRTCLTNGKIENSTQSVRMSNVKIIYLPFISLLDIHKWRRKLEDLNTGKTFQLKEKLVVPASNHSKDSFYTEIESEMWLPTFKQNDQVSVNPSRDPENGNYVFVTFLDHFINKLCQYYKEGNSIYFRHGFNMTLEKADLGAFKINGVVISLIQSLI